MPVYAKNKKALFDYEILEKIEAGLVLSGQEVKAIRNGQINLKGSFITAQKGELFLTNTHISKYKFTGPLPSYEPTRTRKLLLNKKEIAYLTGKMQEKGLTIVPISVYTKGAHIKVEIGIAKGKKKHDKRESIKKRDQDRNARIELKGRY